MSSMDTFFLLDAGARGRFLRIAGHFLGCTYICTWSPLYHPLANHLISNDGWHHEQDSDRPSSLSGSISLRLFHTYRGSLCSIQSGCVPGLAYKNGAAYIELRDADLMHLASTHVQRQFYQEAGTKTAVFMGCKRGEIELGLTTSVQDISISQMNVQQVFSEDFIKQSLREHFFQRSQLGDLTPPPDESWLSSSSSSLRSLSAMGTSQSSPGFLTKASAPFMPEAYSFATPTSLDEAITTAMIAVISSTSLSSPLMHQQALQQQRQTYHRRIGQPFKPYDPTLAPRLEARLNFCGQRMIKMGIDILRRISMERTEARVQARAQQYRQARNQLCHMISERKRRKKLKEYFHALRLLLPPGYKNDKASVLANTKDYLNSLKAHISELEERNHMLETLQLQRPADDDDADDHSDSKERIEVEISRSLESISEVQQINLSIIVKEECEMTDLVVRVLECLKGTRGVIALVSIEWTQAKNTSARANLRLQAKASDWDEEAFKEAVIHVLARRATATP